MKRRSFVKNMSLASISVPFIFKDLKFEAISKKLFEHSRFAEDRVLVIVRMNGGNDGLNTLIPLDQYDNLVVQRSNVIIPETNIIPLTSTNGLHPSMTGMASMFNTGNLAVIQNVGYPEQNRSHFRSMDIWSYGSLDQATNTGWMGRNFDANFANFPDDYPNTDYPDPFAISMGYEVSATCQGLMGNFSHTVSDPFQAVNVGTGSAVNDGTYYGSHMEYLSTIIAQTNAYGQSVNDAANNGSTLSTLYDANNPLAVHLRYVAQMISGGLQTKVYIVNINGFDTHSAQVDANDNTIGSHADLLKSVSDAIAAFQDDLNLLGLNQRVAGMTFSEFGRQIASNASDGTDHGDAAPLFLFGSCLSGTIIGPNPTITNLIEDQAGIPMQIDFRDVYASIVRDWFQVDEAEVQTMFEHNVTFYPLLRACNLGINDLAKLSFESIVYPNPCVNHATLKFLSKDEWVKVTVYDLNGREFKILIDKQLDPKQHEITFDTSDLPLGTYQVQILKKSGEESVRFVKLRTN
ncbi:MAG: DUF1501 domain-containing protein [Flavobacteriia bacterium]|jgi:uncharacterized protein (DUF1501 family)